MGRGNELKTAIIIPARYASTRFPGKPLALLGGRSMLSRVVDIARTASDKTGGEVVFAVATEDRRIADHCAELGVECVMTPADCPTGSDRVLAAVDSLGKDFDFIIGLQGDAPFTPPAALRTMIEAFNGTQNVLTPCVRLRWSELDTLREKKRTTPFSGTTVTVAEDGRALWFSKTILPAIRKEEVVRKGEEYSPVRQHIGLYGFRPDTLRRFVSLPQSPYEKLEGLEQLRLLENGIPVHIVTLDLPEGYVQTGIDSPEDLERAQILLKA